MQPVSGETNQSFTAAANGSYAVMVTGNGCTDTSSCYSITNVGIVENTFGSHFIVYPNPTAGSITIDLGQQHSSLNIIVKNITGQVISSTNFKSTHKVTLEIQGAAGFYFLHILTAEGSIAAIKVMKK